MNQADSSSPHLARPGFLYRIDRYSGPLLIALAALFLIAQVLVRPAVGIANNGDFPKMAGPLGLGPAQGTWESHKQYGEFVYQYERADRYFYNRDFRTAPFWSSEFFFVKIARGLQRLFHPGPQFDIRWLGGVYGAFLLLAIGFWIYAFPRGLRWLCGMAAVLILTDVAYVQYLNSFYMDTPAIIFLILAAGAGVHAAYRPANRIFPLVTIVATLLFATSKSQHAAAALWLGLLFIAFAFIRHIRSLRLEWIAGALILPVATWSMLHHDTESYQSTGVFNIVFMRIAPSAPNPLRALEELGLGRNEMPYLRTHAYFPNSPMNYPDWVARFALRCNHATLLRYYLHHPSVPLHFLYEDLSVSAADMEPFANLSPDDGYPVDRRASGFSYWSGLRAFLLRKAPWCFLLLVMAVFGLSAWLFVRSPADRACAVVALAIQTIAVFEYGVAVLVDAAEIARHVTIANMAMDLSILLLLILISRVRVLAPQPAARLKSRRVPAQSRRSIVVG
ncbi:MAG TPA: hypothetical protein VGL82_09385 [Bryobacteraceae bacterium]|jgi:hypothetical protein